MYTVSVKRDFIAQHFLIGGDWGKENFVHSHHFIAELRLHGEQLDRHGYLVDIVDIEAAFDLVVESYRDRTLNELPEFAGINPSIEHFSRILCLKLSERIVAPNIQALTLKLWETPEAWASYELKK
ncbi:6-pyruvoyl trahydropterin synthase family protein [Cohnella silvisoli]|uniref:6-carboxy-5,6,7,8-tetrahydropterin synthase n=1 Tax=Cohnella silvisoli TaxID=2873699 RepID=A0ABV1KSW1_9BACL|nr:6-carboxytetrahydropterin synthase [Cohnella silvisoli]MCD9021763.1 6-carboxytetrahydropterin synthase [Cohnella silvisoli]